ncbi:hypothetical protein ES703_110531 [subsurface metagenome]
MTSKSCVISTRSSALTSLAGITRTFRLLMYPVLLALVGYGLGAGGAGGTGASVAGSGSTGAGAGSVGVGFGDIGLRPRGRAVGSEAPSAILWSRVFWARAELPIPKLKTTSTIIVLVKDFIFLLLSFTG